MLVDTNGILDQRHVDVAQSCDVRLEVALEDALTSTKGQYVGPCRKVGRACQSRELETGEMGDVHCGRSGEVVGLDEQGGYEICKTLSVSTSKIK